MDDGSGSSRGRKKYDEEGGNQSSRREGRTAAEGGEIQGSAIEFGAVADAAEDTTSGIGQQSPRRVRQVGLRQIKIYRLTKPVQTEILRTKNM